jgi:hypothetical protein
VHGPDGRARDEPGDRDRAPALDGTPVAAMRPIAVWRLVGARDDGQPG